MQPRPIRAEENLVGTGTSYRLFKNVEPAHTCGVRKDIRMSHEMIDERRLRPPIVCETAEVGDDERNIRVFLRQDFRHGDLTHHVIKDRNAVAACGSADFACYPGVVTMDFDPYEPEFADRLADHGIHAALVGQWMHKGKPEKMAGIARNDPCHFSIRMHISIRKRGTDHRSVDAGRARTLEIFVERSGGVGPLGQAGAFSRMTM